MNPAPAPPGLPGALPTPVAILGVPFDPVTTEQTVELIAGMVASRRPHYAVTANVDFVVQAQSDVELRRILFDAHLVLCDGMPLVWASRLLGRPLPERVTGSDLMPRLLAEGERRGWRVFFLGGTPESVAAAAARTLERHPRLRLVGAYSPPFKPLLEMDHADLLRRVSAAQPDVLFVAFGCPKQEKWINMHYRHLGVPLSIGVGATIDFIAGTFKRAPAWMQRTGTEWLFRLAQEPRRLARRYGRGFWIFGGAIFRQWRQLRSRPRPAPQPAPAPSPGPQVPGTVLAAPERIDASAAPTLGPVWLAALDQGDLVLDLAGTTFIDSTGIGLLTRLRKRAAERRRRLLLARIPARVEEALRLMKIEGFFDRAVALPAADAGSRPADQDRVQVGESGAPNRLLLVWRGEVTAATVPEVAEEAEMHLATLPAGSRVHVDLAGVPFLDSSGLGLMVRLKKRAHRNEVTVTYRDPAPAVLNVLRLARLEDYLLGGPP